MIDDLQTCLTRGCWGSCRAVEPSCRGALCCSMPSRLRWSRKHSSFSVVGSLAALLLLTAAHTHAYHRQTMESGKSAPLGIWHGKPEDAVDCGYICLTDRQHSGHWQA